MTETSRVLERADDIGFGGQSQADFFGIQSPGEFIHNISGGAGADAVREGARLQEQLGREGLLVQEQAQRRLEETLAPFVGFSTDLLPRFEGLFASPVDDQVVTDLTQLATPGMEGNFGITPLAGDIMQQNNPLLEFNLSGRERGDLLSALRLGQASAAQQAAGGLQTGGARQDLLTQIGNVQAAGALGAAQARGQGAQNLVGLGTTIAGSFR
jgi:hypothetical protein